MPLAFPGRVEVPPAEAPFPEAVMESVARGSRAGVQLDRSGRAGWRRADVLGVIVVAACIALMAALSLWDRSVERAALLQLPEGERRALFDAALATLRGPCRVDRRPAGLESFCREQARLILDFPQCDA